MRTSHLGRAAPGGLCAALTGRALAAACAEAADTRPSTAASSSRAAPIVGPQIWTAFSDAHHCSLWAGR